MKSSLLLAGLFLAMSCASHRGSSSATMERAEVELLDLDDLLVRTCGGPEGLEDCDLPKFQETFAAELALIQRHATRLADHWLRELDTGAVWPTYGLAYLRCEAALPSLRAKLLAENGRYGWESNVIGAEDEWLDDHEYPRQRAFILAIEHISGSPIREFIRLMPEEEAALIRRARANRRESEVAAARWLLFKLTGKVVVTFDEEAVCSAEPRDVRLLESNKKGSQAVLLDARPPDAIETLISGNNACARTSTGDVLCWGENDRGQVGDGTRSPRARAFRVPLPVAVKQFAMHWHSGRVLALGGDGAVWQWGSTEEDGIAPLKVTALTDADEVSVGGGHGCARLSTGQVWCWGYGRYGQLGDGRQKDSRKPVLVRMLPPAVQLVAGLYFTCARVRGDDVWCWGNGRGGEDGTSRELLTTYVVPELRGVQRIVALNSGVCGAWPNGRLACCSYELRPDSPDESSPELRCRPVEATPRACMDFSVFSDYDVVDPLVSDRETL